MFGSLLLVLSAVGAEPVEVNSLATCTRPAAKLVAPKIEHAAGATRSTDCRQIALWLRRWEQTSKRLSALPGARRDVLRHRAETAMNAHAATALEQLAGSLDVTKLRETFDWTITERTAAFVSLEAVPRDETERLFYGSIQVRLDAADGSLDQLQLTDRQGERRVTWRCERTIETSPIQLVSASDAIRAQFELLASEDVPPTPTPEPPRRFLVLEADCEGPPVVR